MKDVVIFGGTGFVGHHLADWLERRGAERIMLADIAPPRRPVHHPIQFIPCDVRKPISLTVESDTTVFNLAAIHRTPGHADTEYFETNVAGAKNVLEFCQRSGISRVFFTSSIAVYGPSEAPVTESTRPRPGTAYGRSKLEAEEIHSSWAEDAGGRRLVTTRPGTVFGPGEGGNFTRLAAALEKRRFGYPGRRDTVKACGYVTDLLESLLFVERRAAPVITYNFALPKPPTIEEVCDAFCKVGGFPRPRAVVPTNLLLATAKLLSGLGVSDFNFERVMKLVQSTNIVPQVLMDEGYPYRFDLEVALADWIAKPPEGRFV